MPPETARLFLATFTLVFIGLAFLSFLSGGIPVWGRRYRLVAHPALVRLRYLALGLFFGLCSQHYDWTHPGWVGFLDAVLLVVSSVRT